MDDADKRTERPSASVSPNELALINQVRGDVTMGAWLREAAMQRVAAELGVDPAELDAETRRPARRRRNLTERKPSKQGSKK